MSVAAVVPPRLLARARALAADGPRRILGLAGAPGAGKSTLAAALVAGLGADAVLVPMDGFHLADPELRRLGRWEDKGAPDTFDAAGYVALLRRLASPRPGETVYAPEFDRGLEAAIAGSIPVPAEVPLVVTEGNYLLLDADPWREVRELLDESWYVDVDPTVRRAWLAARHERHGRGAAESRARTLGPDEANARLVAGTAGRADVRVAPWT